LVEHRSPKPRAVGSSPSTPASIYLEASAPMIGKVQPNQRESGQRETLLLGLSLALLACLPVLVASFPMMSDYPAHLARYHVMLDQGKSGFLTHYYSFKWAWSGNLGVDLLIWPLANLFGLEAAGRIIAGVIPPLTGLGIITVEWVLRRRIGPGSLLALATIWSPAMVLGFLNFTLSLALALFAFALWVVLEGKRWRGALFLPIGLIVWLCHQSGWGVLGVMVFGYEWQRQCSWSAFLAPWPLFAPLVPTLLLSSGPAGALSYGKLAFTYKWGIWWRALRDHDQVLDVASVGLLMAAIGLAALCRRIDGRLGWSALLVALLAVFMPRHLGGGDYADYRLTAVALMLGCLSVDLRPKRWMLWLCAALFLLRLGVTASAWHRESQALEQMLPALDKAPQGAVIAEAVLYELEDWQFGAFEHAAGYAVVRRDALVNINFAVKGVHMLELNGTRADFIDPSQRIFHSRGAKVDLSSFGPAQQADYLWYIGGPRPSQLPLGAVVMHRTAGSLFARLAKPARPR